MKLWQKIFIFTLSLFLIVFDTSIIILTQITFENSLQREMKRGIAEQHFLANSLSMDLSAFLNRGTDVDIAMESLFRSYTSYYKNHKIYLEISKNNASLFSNIPRFDGYKEKLDVDNSSVRTIIRDVNNIKYIYISSNLITPDDVHYGLLVSVDISDLVTSQNKITRFLIILSILVSFLLSFILYVVLRRFLDPIRKLSESTKLIASGNYQYRVEIPGKDEIADLAVNFNNMSSEVQHHIMELELMASRKQQFIDNLAHELRTPLTSIYGYAEYIQNANTTTEDRLSATGYILSESRRLQHISNKLLHLALLRQNELEMQEIDVVDLFERCIKTLIVQASDKQIEIEKSVSIKTVSGDEELLQSLICNLLENAIRASVVGGKIKLSSYKKDLVILEVQDFGCGLSKEQLENIGEPFYRVHKSRSRNQGGAGLGISLCMQIAKLHGAELVFTSVIGEGTKASLKFTVS